MVLQLQFQWLTSASTASISSTMSIAGDTGTDSIVVGTDTFTISGGTGLTSTATTDTITLNIDSTVATLTGSQTLTNKTISLTNNTVSGTTAEFNSALSDGSFATLAGTETLTNKTLTSPVIATISNTGTVTLPTSTDTLVGRATTDTLTNKTINSASNTLTLNLSEGTLTGTTAQFNTALSDGSFATLAGTETLTGKTIDSASNTLTLDLSEGTLTGTTAEFNTALSDANFVVQDGSGNVTVSGNLTVNGTTTTVASANTTIADNLLELNSGAASNANDTGILIERGSTGDNAIMAWDESADKFIFGTTTATASDTGDLTIASGTIVASTFEGALSGNATTATTLQTARTIAGVSFDGSANITIASTDLSDTASIALLTATQTFTNKTIAAASNTISGLTSSNFNSAVQLDILDSTGSTVKSLFGSAT